MPYRDSARALTERYEALEHELRASRERTRNLEELRAQETRIAAELAEVARKLDELRSHARRLPLLDNVAIASPCSASWDKMQGDDRVRFCGDCQKNVYNLSALPRQEAEGLLAAHAKGELCVRLYRREDGTVLTQDCPVGVTRKRRRKLAFGIAGATALTAAAVTSLLQRTSATPHCPSEHHAMGAVAMPIEPAADTIAKPTTDDLPKPPMPHRPDDGVQELGRRTPPREPGYKMGAPVQLDVEQHRD